MNWVDPKYMMRWAMYDIHKQVSSSHLGMRKASVSDFKLWYQSLLLPGEYVILLFISYDSTLLMLLKLFTLAMKITIYLNYITDIHFDLTTAHVWK